MATSTIHNEIDLKFRGNLGASDNLDDYIGFEYNGVWYLGATPINSPVNYAPLLVIATYSDSGVQVIFRPNLGVYMRQRSGSPRAWSSWFKVTSTGV